MEEKLISILRKASEVYYNSGDLYVISESEKELVKSELNIEINSIISDAIYDNLYSILKQRFPFNQFFNIIGADVSEEYGKDVIFENPEGSLCELKEGDWEKWKIKTTYIISHKLDGCSVILFYKNGKLVQAASRGNGYKGKDITRHILQIRNIPKTIPVDPYGNNEIEIRGELICPINDIPLMIEELKEETGREYKNGRNTISGFITSKNTLKSVAKYAHFVAFKGVFENKSKSEEFLELSRLGFEVPHYYYIPFDISEKMLIDFVKTAKSSDYECDGIVITQDISEPGYEGFESGTINPKNSRKFKIGAINNTAESVVKNIIWEISKDGYFKPVVEIEPVELVGVTVVKATGNNYKYLVDNKLGIGSRVIVKRAGDVIPQIIDILSESSNLNLPLLECIEEGVELRLKDLESDNEYTKEMNIKKMSFFCGVFGIDFMGYGNAKKMYEFYKQPFSLLFLEKKDFEEVFGVNGAKAYDSIHEKLNEMTEAKLFAALGTFGRGISVTMLEKIEEKWGTLDVSKSQLESTDGFGIIRIPQYLEHINEYRHEKELYLKQYTFKKKSNIVLKSNKFSKYNVCFTGVRSKELMKIINENGGKASESWSKDVNLLIAKDPNGSSGKIKNAHQKGIEIISLEEAEKLFNEIEDELF